MRIAAANSYKYVSDRYPIKRTTNGWWIADCPFCGKRGKFAFNFNWSRSKCWSCEWSESIVDMVMELEGLSYIQALREVMDASGEGVDPALFEIERSAEVSEVELPFGYRPLLEGGGGVLGKRAVNYLIGRGFEPERLDAQGFGYVAERAPEGQDDYFGRIIMPIQQDGKLRYYIGRDYIGGFPKYMNPSKDNCGVGKDQVIYGADAFNRFKTAYVTEGIFNAMTLGDKGAATLGWSWSKDQLGWMLNSSCSLIVVLADPGFYSKAVKNALKLIDHKRVKVVDFDTLDHDEDVNTLGAEKTMEFVNATPDLTYGMAVTAMMG